MFTNKFPLGNSVVVLAKDMPGKILSVHRRTEPHYFCFPGGKQESGESSVLAAKRELFEETGVDVSENELFPIFAGFCAAPQEKTYFVTAYVVVLEKAPLVFNLTEEEKEMNPQWVNVDEFLNYSAFTVFNLNVIHQAKALGYID